MSEQNEKPYTKIYVVPRFQLGDLVSVKGYGEDVFQIEGYSVEGHRSLIEGDFDVVVYDLMRVRDGDVLIAEDPEMTLVCPCDQADHYIEANIREFEPGDPFESYDEIMGQSRSLLNDYVYSLQNPKEAVVMKKVGNHRDREKAEIARRKEYKTRINTLLDRANALRERGHKKQANEIFKEMRVLAGIYAAGGHINEALDESEKQAEQTEQEAE